MPVYQGVLLEWVGGVRTCHACRIPGCGSGWAGRRGSGGVDPVRGRLDESGGRGAVA